MAPTLPFSARHQFAQPKEISIREDAPEGLRYVVVDTARGLGWQPSALRSIVCRVLRVKPDSGNWGEYPNIWEEVTGLIDGCPWFKVYDVIEELHAAMIEKDRLTWERTAGAFTDMINRIFLEDGIGWQLVDGYITTRGDAAFETLMTEAQSQLIASGRPTAAKHINQAIQCLSHRPEPNLPGATFHAMGSLECIARDVTGNAKATLGEILKRYPALLPRPLDEALSKIWGYASNEARHVEEGREISRDEAELVVGLSASVGAYLARKAIA